ncbi:hypothetical protein ACLMJK_004750 [Lecanora helva]
MPLTGLFYLPAQTNESSQTNDILNRLTSTYNPSPLPPWTLSHRLFRETPTEPTADKSRASPQQRYLQTLALSHHAPRAYVAITSTNAPPQSRAMTPASSSNISTAETASGEPATLISIPSGSSHEDFVQLVVSKLSPLWQQRQVLTVPQGYAFEVGDFKVRIGELRQGGAGGGGGAQMGRGTVVEVEWSGDEEKGEEDWESAEAVIGAFWDGLGVKGAKRAFWFPGLREGEGSVRQWCEILRIRV